MKRRIWLIAGLAAIVVSAWIIKRAQKSAPVTVPGSVTEDGKQVVTPGEKPLEQDSSDLKPGQTASQSGPSTNGEGEHSNTTPNVHAVPGAPVGAGAEIPSINATEPRTTSAGEGQPNTSLRRDGAASQPGEANVPGSVGPGSKDGGAAGRLTGSGTVAGTKESRTQTGVSGSPAAVALTIPKPTPVPTPDVRLKASPAELSCDDQWKQYASIFKVGADLAYMTSIATQRPLASDISTSHIETVTTSSSTSVSRDVAFSSDHPTGILVLATINPAPTLVTGKDTFVSLCQTTGGRAVNSALYKLSRVKLLDIADESVKVGAGTFAAYHMKVEAGLLIGGKVITGIADIWMAKSKSGLAVKEVIRIPPKTFPDHGSITISSQLAGSRKI